MKNSSKKQPSSDPTSVRFGQRIPIAVKARLSIDGQPMGYGTIRNASVSGALIETELNLPLHSNLIVALSIMDGGASTVRDLEARVVRVDAEGLGIEWRDMASVDITELLARASNSRAAK